MGMEKDTREFLIRIANTIGITLLWMLINLLFGLYFNWAFFDGMPRTGNWIFYAWFFLSLMLLIIYLRHQWK